jgi:uncharacterized protein (DUF58 family)
MRASRSGALSRLITHVCKPSIGPILRDAPARAAHPVSATLGWVLALVALVAGYVGYGWPGVLLAFSVVVFWMLLQFSRALRAMREAAGRPVGRVDNAVMLHARLRTGLRLVDVMKLTRSLGQPAADINTPEPEVFLWADEAGDSVRVELRGGRVSAWSLRRADDAPAGPGPTGPTA